MQTVALILFALLLIRWTVFIASALIDHRRQRRRGGRVAAIAERPQVTVVIPAYNEATVIEGTVRSAAASDYRDLEILVVDDGSADDTAAIARATGVTVIALPENGGKSAALNAGIAVAGGEILVTVDADTHLEPDCITRLVQTMAATGAAAVCSNVKVGNRSGLVGHWQSLEYVTGLNIDRRAQCLLGFVTTVPGAAAAWKTSAVRALGGFSSDTLAEDTDLSIAMLREGLTIEFADRAVSWTEAPDRWGMLFRQRVRWLFGNLQCAAKHSVVFWRPAPWKTRLMALPNLWFSHLGIYLLLPLAVVFAVALRTQLSWSWVLPTLGVLLAFDLVSATVAYLLDRDDPTELIHVPLQRLGYPLFLWAVFLTVAVRVAARLPMGWNKVERTGAL